MSKLSTSQRQALRTAVAAGVKVLSLAVEYGVSEAYIYRLRHRVGIFRRA